MKTKYAGGIMRKRSNHVVVTLAVAALFAIGPFVEGSRAQQKAAVPKPQNSQALKDAQVKQLLLLMDTDKNGKISKQEWMSFMEAEFERLDKDKNGELDPKELVQSRVQASTFASAGK
jgi:EF hand